jgi:hypothetical protein
VDASPLPPAPATDPPSLSPQPPAPGPRPRPSSHELLDSNMRCVAP